MRCSRATGPRLPDGQRRRCHLNAASIGAILSRNFQGCIDHVYLCIVNGEGNGVSGRDGLAVVAAAMAGARQGYGVEDAVRLRYEEFVKGRATRKERKARQEGIIDLCCSSVGAAAFLVTTATQTHITTARSM